VQSPATVSHTVDVSKLIETLAGQLERPREITMQVANHLLGSYDVERDAIGAFLEDKLSALEDYEHDLILSPLFTPKLADQAIFADLLGREYIPREQWPGLIAELLAIPVHGQLVTSDRRRHSITLREVTIERYVNRLRLDGSIPESIFVLLETISPVADRPTLKAVARRAIWENEAKRGILERYLTLARDRGVYQLPDAVSLMEIVESYKPADVAALLAMIPPWRDGLRREIDTGGDPKPFFAAAIQGEHGGDRDHRQADQRRLETKRNEFALLGRLQQILAE
jgi:hypothetical protein